MPSLANTLQFNWLSRDEAESSILPAAASLRRTSSPKISNARIRTACWNISAVNNNPFEYWTSNPDPKYDSLMRDIQQFIENPDQDVDIFVIFRDHMFSELCQEMQAQEIDGLEKLKLFWTDDYRMRKAVKGFLKDKSIGTKRLASMPDRITNTINLHDGGVCLRPSVMNAYDGGSMSSLSEWWDQWKNFMFRTQVRVFTGITDTSPEPQTVCSLITSILRGKYPAITEEEQEISVPLQILCLAILDAIFVYIMNSVGGGSWEATRRSLCDALIVGKVPRVCEILASSYSDCDVIFIQEAAAVFVQDARRHAALQTRYCTLAPRVLDGRRDQNSLILVSRRRFGAATGQDVTQQVLDVIGGAWVAPGDLLVVDIEEPSGRGRKWLLASFHGDSNGLSTQPLLLALREIADRDFEDRVLLLGIDANTSSAAAAPADPTYPQSVPGFAAFLAEQQLVSLWGPAPDPAAWTTCSSRTFIQTQLNKAIAFKDRFAKSQRNLKDWIVASERQVLGVTDAARDNTGRNHFVEGTVLPTVEFPSDHAIVSAMFHLRPHPAADAGGVGNGSKSADVKKRIARPARPRLADGRERTLYDYWGIGQKPLAFEREHVGGGSGQARRGELGKTATFEEEVDKLVEDHYVHLVESRTLNDLDQQKREYSRSSDRSIWILFSTRPYTMAIRKFWFQIIVAIAGSAFFAQGALNMASLYKVYTMRARGLRLTASTIRNGSLAVGAPNLAGLGLMQNGCKQTDVAQSLVMSGTAVSIEFALSVPVDGFWIMTSDNLPYLDPGHFMIDHSLDDGSWQPLTAPPWVLQSRMFDIPLDRLKDKYVELIPPVAWVLSSCVGIPGFSLACYLSCMFGLLGWGCRGAIAISCGFFFLAIMQLIWATYTIVALILDSLDGTWDSLNVNDTTAWTSWLFFACSIFLAFTAYYERYTLDSFLIVFTLIGAGMVYDAKDRATSNESGLYRASFSLIWSILPAITLGVLIMARFCTNRWILREFLSADRAIYNAVWDRLLAKDSVPGCVSKICATVRLICSGLEPREARQYLGQVVEANLKLESEKAGSFATGSLSRKFSLQTSLRALNKVSITSWSASKSIIPGRAIVTSLDQLMEQATCLNIFLKKKVQELALKSSGIFQVASDTSVTEDNRIFEQFSESSQDGFNWIWAAPKPSERALEKLLRSYNCDVSRLLDCCRQMITFESSSDMLKCLQLINTDKEIEIVRIKNMLDVKFDSWRTGGFRLDFP